MCLSPIMYLNPRKMPYKVFVSILENYRESHWKDFDLNMSLSRFLEQYISSKGFLTSRGLEALSKIGFSSYLQELPCRTCLECRMENARQWTARCVLEARAHSSNFFVTLTYDDEHVPYAPCGLQTLYYRDFQLFMKRLRRAVDYPIRYRVVSEYGSRTKRPHYHVILFGLHLSDLQLLYYAKHGRKFYKPCRGGIPHYNSSWLRRIWQNGNIDVASVDRGSISYVNDYMLKADIQQRLPDYILIEEFKSNLPQQNACYRSAVQLGEIAPPKHNQSTRPAIGRCAFEEVEQQLLDTDLLPSGLHLPVRYIHYFDRLLFDKYPDIKDERLRVRAALAKAVDYDVDNRDEERKRRGERLYAKIRFRNRSL